MSDFEIAPLGEYSWILTFKANTDDIALARRAQAIAAGFINHPNYRDVITGIDSVCLCFDPERIAPEEAKAALTARAHAINLSTVPSDEEPLVVPIAYGGEFGPDLAALAAEKKCSEESLISAHCRTLLTVLTLGFAPGFVYLGLVDECLRVPRLDTPRQQIPAGSVGIAGSYSCIYPVSSPGGWRLIGRTPLRLFDPLDPEAFVIEPGRKIRFEQISHAAFTDFQAHEQ